MKSKTCLVVAALALSLAACRHPSPLPGAQAHDRSAPHAFGTTLKLNHGRKWVVPPPMMAHLRNIEKAARDLETVPIKNHPALAAVIREQLGELVTKCTMEGKAHDELHKWLMPFLALSEDYFKTTDPRVQEEKFREVQHTLVLFNEYFE